jgi:hypothetical protein
VFELTSLFLETSWLYKNNSFVFIDLLAFHVLQKTISFVFNNLLASFVKFFAAKTVEHHPSEPHEILKSTAGVRVPATVGCALSGFDLPCAQPRVAMPPGRLGVRTRDWRTTRNLANEMGRSLTHRLNFVKIDRLGN